MAVPTRMVDSSFDELTHEEAQCLKEQSWPVYWQCLWTGAVQPRPRVTSLRVAEAEGLLTGAYISLNASQPGAWHIDQGRAGVPDNIWEKLDFVSVDVELRGIHIAEILSAVDRLEELGKDGKVTLYTSYNAWMNYVIPGDSHLISALGIPLNNALWDQHPDFDFPFLRFGGWRDDQVFSEQWSGGSKVCKQFVDRNTIVNPRLIYSEEEENDVTPQELLKQILTLNVPIYPLGGQPSAPVTLSQLLHFAYHGSPREHEGLVAVGQAAALARVVNSNRQALELTKDTLTEHLTVHNQSGGTLDRSSGVYLAELAQLLIRMGEEMQDFAEGIE